MRRYSYRLAIWGSLLAACAVTGWAQETAQKTADDAKATNAPVTFRCRLNYFILQNPPSALPNELKDRNTLDLNLRNNDPSRTIQELEYQIYTKDKQSGVEVDHIRRIDETRIKPGQVKERCALSWNPDSIVKACNPPSKCTIKLRIVRIKYDDGSEWQGQIEAEKNEKAQKN